MELNSYVEISKIDLIIVCINELKNSWVDKLYNLDIHKLKKNWDTKLHIDTVTLDMIETVIDKLLNHIAVLENIDYDDHIKYLSHPNIDKLERIENLINLLIDKPRIDNIWIKKLRNMENDRLDDIDIENDNDNIKYETTSDDDENKLTLLLDKLTRNVINTIDSLDYFKPDGTDDLVDNLCLYYTDTDTAKINVVFEYDDPFLDSKFTLYSEHDSLPNINSNVDDNLLNDIIFEDDDAFTDSLYNLYDNAINNTIYNNFNGTSNKKEKEEETEKETKKVNNRLTDIDITINQLKRRISNLEIERNNIINNEQLDRFINIIITKVKNIPELRIGQFIYSAIKDEDLFDLSDTKLNDLLTKYNSELINE